MNSQIAGDVRHEASRHPVPWQLGLIESYSESTGLLCQNAPANRVDFGRALRGEPAGNEERRIVWLASTYLVTVTKRLPRVFIALSTPLFCT
jgi:hypothetical protein